MAPETRLAQLLCARFCHDLSGSLGTLVGALDLVALADTTDSEALDLARDAAEVMRARLMVMRALAGSGPEDAGAILALLAPALAEKRTELVASVPRALLLEPTAGAMLVAAVLLASEALPRGGTVHLDGDAAGFTLRAEGRNAAWPPALAAALEEAPLSEASSARQVLSPWMVALAGGAGWRVRLAAGAGPTELPMLRLLAD